MARTENGRSGGDSRSLSLICISTAFYTSIASSQRIRNAKVFCRNKCCVSISGSLVADSRLKELYSAKFRLKSGLKYWPVQRSDDSEMQVQGGTAPRMTIRSFHQTLRNAEKYGACGTRPTARGLTAAGVAIAIKSRWILKSHTRPLK